jgi:glycogenin glucosyltransferase
MILKTKECVSHDGGDTGFLNDYFSSWYKMESLSRLPFGYNAQRILYWFTIKRTDGYWK